MRVWAHTSSSRARIISVSAHDGLPREPVASSSACALRIHNGM